MHEDPYPNARKTVLVLSSTYPRWANDHEPNFVHELSKRLTRYHDITVIAPREKDAGTLETMEDVQVHRYRYAPNILSTLVSNGGMAANVKRKRWKWLLLPSFLLSQLLVTYKVARKIRPDIIHAHWIIPQGIIAVLVNLILGEPSQLIITSHGGDLYTFNNKVFKHIKQLVLVKAQLITVVSQAMKDYLISEKVFKEKLEVLPMGVDTDRQFTPQPKIYRNKDQILFVGRIVEKKGLEYLLKALPKILKTNPTTELVIIGDGPYKDHLQKLAIDLKIDLNVSFLGGLPSKDLVHYYRECSVFVAPFVTAQSGDREGLGLVIIEALACNCPIVVSENESLREIRAAFRGNKWIQGVPERDSPAISLAVSNILTALKTEQPTFTDPHKLIAKEYGWTTASNNYLNAYNKYSNPTKTRKSSQFKTKVPKKDTN